MQDKRIYKNLQKSFYDTYSRTFPIQSSQLLSACFHPCFDEIGDFNFRTRDRKTQDSSNQYVLILEQIFQSAESESRLLEFDDSEAENGGHKTRGGKRDMSN